MSPLGGLLITLSCLSPSIGVFVVGSQILHQVGSGALACLLAAVILSFAVGAVYAELGSAFPHTGGEYAMAGRVLGREAGFAMLATNLVGYAIALSLSGLVLPIIFAWFYRARHPFPWRWPPSCW